MEVTNAIKFAAEQDSTEKKGNIYWSQRKYRATIYQNWKTENFPFDRQHLYVELEDGAADISKRIYIPDVKNSSLSQNIILDGFKIKDFQIQELKFNYPTSFGDPEINHAGSTFSRLRIRMTIVRQEFFGFFKLNMGTYIAFAITLLSFLMHPKQTSIFSARMSLLVGSLFAVVISMRASDSIIGTSQGLSLIDQIHITTMVYIFSSAAIAIFSLRCCETGHDKLALRIDARCLWIFAASFVAMNGVLISTAIFRG
ncbi:hypothetical protein [Calothrix sp. 336/3]|nr:hypothetical protein [Calothrix sp. 336/3]